MTAPNVLALQMPANRVAVAGGDVGGGWKSTRVPSAGLLEAEASERAALADRSHDALALELGTRWAADARYIAALSAWLFFDGVRWREDDQLEHMTRARSFLREKAEELIAWAAARDRRLKTQMANGTTPAEGERGEGGSREQIALAAKAMRSAQTVAQVISLARSNLAQAATLAQWDADPYLLGTPGGTVDLRTGSLRPAEPGDFITKTTAVAPAAAGARPALFLEKLARWTDGDEALMAYLQRYAGYAATGSIVEHAFAFAHGGGGNGKSVFVETLLGIMGEYACVIPTEMLVVSQNDRHPTEIARLMGVRLAVGSETEQGTRWAESQIKRLTGGDRIAARRMRQDFFEFSPQFKLFVVGNHKPALRAVDAAMRRRMHLIPFTVTIPESERDPHLPEKLRAEWPAILRWIIDGAVLWQREGLNPPESVRGATSDYLEAEDAVSLWLEERTQPNPDAWEPTSAYFASWKDWAERGGEYVGSQKRLAQVLGDHGLAPHRAPGGQRGFRGRRILPRPGEARWGE